MSASDWKIYQTDFFVKLENNRGQFATGYSTTSYAEALENALLAAYEREQSNAQSALRQSAARPVVAPRYSLEELL